MQVTRACRDNTDFDLTSPDDNTFTVRAAGGTAFFSSGDQTTGVLLPAGGGAWVNLSDRNVKENFEKVDSREILERLATIPIETWNYKAQDDVIRHIGPMAQDFHAAFAVGGDDKHISTIDPPQRAGRSLGRDRRQKVDGGVASPLGIVRLRHSGGPGPS